jgi:hypothetical protein
MSRTICLEAVDVSMQADYTGSVCKLLGLKAAVLPPRWNASITVKPRSGMWPVS